MDREFSTAILRVAEATSATPEEVDAAVFRVRSRAWAERHIFVGEAEALRQVAVVLSIAEIGAEELVRKIREGGATSIALPTRRWGLRRGAATLPGAGRVTSPATGA
jgi:hypothetical protein